MRVGDALKAIWRMRVRRVPPPEKLDSDEDSGQDQGHSNETRERADFSAGKRAEAASSRSLSGDDTEQAKLKRYDKGGKLIEEDPDEPPTLDEIG